MSTLADIERDLRAFADPWSAVAVDSRSAVWERNGVTVSVDFVRSETTDFPDVVLNGVRQPYRSFLAGPAMADLARFADFLIKTHPRQEQYIDTNAVLHEEDGDSAPTSAANLVRMRSTEDLPFLSTRVVLVKGEAGSGKTVALRETASRQAEAFLQGRATCLFFLVDAQGRALSRLEDAMAKDLQDVRAGFPYAAVAPLTRHNLLIPIIDGFDELLGSGGYDEAFSSLAAFLATLEGRGAVVASARSAFFDYRNFYDNAQRFSGDGRLNYQVDTLSVQPWNDAQVRHYVAGYAAHHKQNVDELVKNFDQLAQRLDAANKQLLTKPFYASKVAELLASGSVVRADQDLLDQLVDAFIDREHRKLLDKDNRPLLSPKGHQSFLTALAEEMWWQENRRLDVGTVQAAAELVTEAFGLPPTAAQQIVERVSSYAFLTSDGSSRRTLKFEHEVFYGYFLAHKLREFVEGEPGDLRRFIGRSVVEPTLIDQTVRLVGNDPERCSKAVGAIVSVLRPTLSEVLARDNAGALISALWRAAGELRPGIMIQHVVFRQLLMGPATAREISFSNCDFSEVDFSDVQLVNPKFQNCALRNITVDIGTTRFVGVSQSFADIVHGVVVRGEQRGIAAGRVFDPAQTMQVLLALGMVAPPVSPPRSIGFPRPVEIRVELLERFLKKMERRFYASAEDIKRFPFAARREWDEVLELLIAHKVLQEHHVQRSGPHGTLMRLSVPPEVVRRGQDLRDPKVPAHIKDFWRAVLAS